MGQSLHYAVPGQGASMDEAGEHLRQAIETALATADAAALAELIEDHDDPGLIGEVQAGVLEVQVEDVAADLVG
jgi:ATP/maltotriose-dependent transcriptional regulator MalT